MNQAFRVSTKSGNASKLPALLKHFNLMFYSTDTDLTEVDRLDEMWIDKGILSSSDLIPSGFIDSKKPEVASLLFVQVILFMAIIVDGPGLTSQPAPDPRIDILRLEIVKERREA